MSGSHVVLLSARNDDHETIARPRISETKSAKRLTKKVVGDLVSETQSDLATTIQPVLQLLFTGQLLQTPDSCNCFYMNHYKVRPYIYFPADDIMLTTKRACVWKAEDRLMLRGCVLIAIIMRLKSIKRIPSTFWTTNAIPSTNFILASRKAKCTIIDS